MKTQKSVLQGLVAGMLLASSSAYALEAGDWIVRFGATNVSPNDSSDTVDIKATGTPVVAGSEVDVDDNTQLGINIGYMLTDNWGLELLAATPFKHNIGPNAALAGLTGSADIGETKHLPPTLSLNYHFMPKNNIRPYVGVGVNYTTFFDEDTSNGLEALGYTDLDLDDSWGFAGQVGVDVDVSDNWFLNGSVRYIDINTSATIKNGVAGTLEVDDIDIDPWVFTLAIGTTF
jgi:outer membrane protein